MTVSEWVSRMRVRGGVCGDYMRKLDAVVTKAEMFRVLCDVNGGAWVFELHSRGVDVPIAAFLNEFRNYVNGGEVVRYPSGYTSKFYCRHVGDIEADTTLVYLLECMDAEVIVPRHHYSTLILSDGSQAGITLEEGARLDVELYGDACINNITGDRSKIRVTQH